MVSKTGALELSTLLQELGYLERAQVWYLREIEALERPVL